MVLERVFETEGSFLEELAFLQDTSRGRGAVPPFSGEEEERKTLLTASDPAFGK